MSSLIVEVCKVDEVKKHPTADRMCICKVKGWIVCAGRDPVTGKNEFEPGDAAIYIPPDCVLPVELSDRLNVTKYLSNGRVRVARLRSQPSYGFISPVPKDKDWPVGTNVAELLGITKWEPPLECSDGDAERPHPGFHKYTDIENYRNFPALLKDGEEVIFTEKIHGKNARVGLVFSADDNGNKVAKFMAGSHDEIGRAHV